jgi:hypothetical protein
LGTQSELLPQNVYARKQIITRIPFLNHNSESSGRHNRQCL